jgi:NADH-quinone oxidoreductase subunit J
MLIAAFRVVTTSNVVHAALWLVIVLAGVAAQFILLGAEFVAVTQVLVYIGAVVVLFLFGVMLTRASQGDDESVGDEKRSIAAFVGVLLFSVMAMALIDTWSDDRVVIDEPQRAREVSDSIFSQYIVPFEAVSVLLLAALIGAIVVARKD